MSRMRAEVLLSAMLLACAQAWTWRVVMLTTNGKIPTREDVMKEVDRKKVKNEGFCKNNSAAYSIAYFEKCISVYR